MRTLDPEDLLFVGAFVAVLCLGIAGLVSVAGPSVAGFSSALVAAFSFLALVFLALGVGGAVLVSVFGE